MKIVLVSKSFLGIEQNVEFKMSVLISPSKSLISLRWVTILPRISHFAFGQNVLFCGIFPFSMTFYIFKDFHDFSRAGNRSFKFHDFSRFSMTV